jgi:GntR family transcriptional regulator
MAKTKRELLREQIEQMIERKLVPHDRLPTERDLAAEFGVSRMTVRQVMGRFEQERRVYRVQGAGTFVAPRPIAKSIELTSFTEDMRSRGMQPGSRLRVKELVPAGADVGLALGLSPSVQVLHIERVRTADGQPMCLEHVYLPAAIVPELLNEDWDGSIYDLLRDRYRILPVRAEQTVRATVLDETAAALLEVPPFSPALLVQRTTYDQRDRPVEHAASTYRGDRYEYHITLTRPSEG